MTRVKGFRVEDVEAFDVSNYTVQGRGSPTQVLALPQNLSYTLPHNLSYTRQNYSSVLWTLPLYLSCFQFLHYSQA